MRKVTVVKPKNQNIEYSSSGRKLIKVAAYCRVSTMHETQTTSIDSQIRHYTEKIQSNPEWLMVKIYSDHGKSGTSTFQRDEFNQMIDDARKGKIDLILTKSVSRFSRNTVDTLSIVKELRQIGVGVFFETENSNSLATEWDFLLTMHSAIAQEESRSKSQSIKWGYARKFEKGEVVFSTLYGYYSKDGVHEIVEEEAEVVKRVFREFLNGSSYNEIARGLNKSGLKTRRGNLWSFTNIRDMVSNEKYSGDSKQMKTYSTDYSSKKRHKNNGDVESYFIENSIPVIISKEIYSLTQREIARRKLISLERASFEKDYKQSNAFSHKYALSNVMEWGCCGAKYRRQKWTARGNHRVVWRCLNRLTNGVKACPNCPTILEEKVHSIIVFVVNSMIEDKKKILDDLRQKIIHLNEKQKEEYKIELMNSISILENKYSKLLKDNIENSVYNSGELKVILSKLSDEVKEKKQELGTINDNETILKNELIYYEYLKNDLDSKDTIVINYSDELVHNRINKIIVNPSEIIIEFHNQTKFKYKL